jgi:signal transduction histidine kinase
MLQELEKDVSRLELIAERFSKIGSAPTLTPMSIREALQPAVEYLRTRASSQVAIQLDIVDEATVRLNAPLFDWVIENLVKNALDAIEGRGNITIEVHKISNSLAIDVTDTGKGIPKSRFKQVFQPGYSTKKRGWGLGLTLTKRIVENYHKGKIFVKSSTIGKGTTFRILLPL